MNTRPHCTSQEGEIVFPQSSMNRQPFVGDILPRTGPVSSMPSGTIMHGLASERVLLGRCTWLQTILAIGASKRSTARRFVHSHHSKCCTLAQATPMSGIVTTPTTSEPADHVQTLGWFRDKTP